MTKFNLIRFVKSEEGATAIEYGLIAALICVAAIGAMSMVGDTTSSMWDYVATTANAAMGGGVPPT